MTLQILESQIDNSVNFILPTGDEGYFESRFVQRQDDTFIVYLSSMSGCDRACRFCHLTQTGQTSMSEAWFQEYLDQAKHVLEWANRKCDHDKVENIHFNFMARGDLLNNLAFKSNPHRLLLALEKMAKPYFPDTTIRFKLSTIFPDNVNVGTSVGVNHVLDLIVDSIGDLRYNMGKDVEIYYSLYSLDEKFRKKWLPKTLDPELVGEALRGMHEGLRLHHALIAGQNDRDEDADEIGFWLEKHDLKAMVNIVRYNPHNEKSGVESSDIVRAQYIERLKRSPRILLVQEIPRVGQDVMASCGTFFSG